MISLMCILMLTLCMQHAAFARRYRRPRPVPLTPVGQRLAVEYSAMLQSLRQKIINALPSIKPGMEKRFMAAYRAETACKPYLLSPTWVYHVGESRALAARQLARARGSNKSYADALIRCQNVATPILDQINGFLSRDNLDAVLIKASILGYATPRGLAAFAQQSKSNEALIHSLLANPALMKQMQSADGPRNGNYGLAMQIYNTIEKSSPQARHGILQRVALAVALVQKPLRATSAFNPVRRYYNYQQAYLKRQLDPVFPTLTTWQCQFVVNDSYPNRDISWFRHMLMNYEPDYVFSGHYLNIVHTDVGYSAMHYGCVSGNKPSQLIAGGGECGARAWIGRLAERAFGIPTWGVKQRGHAALSIWTRNGWITQFSAGWQWVWWNKRGGLNFYLETQARRYPRQFMKVLRAQWVAAAIGEKKPNLRVPGTGGFWYALAMKEQRAIVASGGPTLQVPTNAQLARMYGPTQAQMVEMAPVSRTDLEVTTDSHGVITIPAAAYDNHARRVPGVTTMKSFSGGLQIYYHCGQPAWKKHHPFQYIVKASRSGRYEMQAQIDSVKPTEYLNLLVNHSSAPVTITIPWTNGMWQQTKPVEITLIRGDNTLTFNRGQDTGFPAKGIFALSIKTLVLTPRSVNQ